jgi:lauroyl/myristoyl acyltransferase
MQLLIYILVYPILWIISILPFPIFYLLSDAICILVYNIIGYRKKVVRKNIQLALPHLSEKEQLTVEKLNFKTALQNVQPRAHNKVVSTDYNLKISPNPFTNNIMVITKG